MSYWGGWPRYTSTPVSELKAKAQKLIQAERKKGYEMQPIEAFSARTIATSWWGRSWCENLESYADLAYRLERGKKYVRAGAVADLKIEKGKILAQVVGSQSSPYQVEIRITPLSEERQKSVLDQCSRKIESLETLLNGTFPPELKELFTGRGGLFPTPGEIQFDCSCLDFASMCKHVAAVMYGIGVRLDDSPLLFFELRGIDTSQFIDVTLGNKVESMLKNAQRPSERIMDDDLVHDVFGIL